MDIGFSSSFPLSGVPSSAPPDSLNGLTFGHKIYFENVGVGAPNISSGGAPSSPAKKVKGVVQGPQPPRCQVEGCKVDLSDAKAYYSRHKVCGMHSKSPKVTVAGLEQRFCQQCSRFHRLPEFDQGKRSCRRRLAGHNERRRKPPPGSLFSSRYGKFTPSIFGNCSSGGGILVNFSAYAGPPGRNPWQTARSSDTAGKYRTQSWQSGSENDRLNSNLLVQGSSAGTGYPGIPSGECFSGVVSDSDCALSLLSNQQWASRNQAPGLRVNNSMHNESAAVVQSTTVSQGVDVNHFPSTSCFVSSCSDDMLANRGLRQVPQTVENSEFTCSVDRPYMELEHCRVYDSTQQMHWSL